MFAAEYYGALNIPHGFRWGGLAGGGSHLAPSAIATNTFVYRVTWGNVDWVGCGLKHRILWQTQNQQLFCLVRWSCFLRPLETVLQHHIASSQHYRGSPAQ